jgi:hypothetical protein
MIKTPIIKIIIDLKYGIDTRRIKPRIPSKVYIQDG